MAVVLTFPYWNGFLFREWISPLSQNRLGHLWIYWMPHSSQARRSWLNMVVMLGRRWKPLRKMGCCPWRALHHQVVITSWHTGNQGRERESLLFVVTLTEETHGQSFLPSPQPWLFDITALLLGTEPEMDGPIIRKTEAGQAHRAKGWILPGVKDPQDEGKMGFCSCWGWLPSFLEISY